MNCNELELTKINIAKNLKEERLRLQLTQKQLAELIGCQIRTITSWENAKTSPGLVDVYKLVNLGFLIQLPYKTYSHQLTECETNLLREKLKDIMEMLTGENNGN